MRKLKHVLESLEPSLYCIHTLGEGSCMVHAMLQACEPEDYTKLDHSGRLDMAKQFREELSKRVSVDDWENDAMMYYNFREKLGRVIDEIRDRTPVIDALKEETYRNFKQHIRENVSHRGDSDLIQMLEDYVFTQYVNSIKNPKNPMDSTMLKMVEDVFDVDVYMLTERHGLPYRSLTNKQGLDRKAVILYWRDSNHYEPVVRVTGNTYQSKFDSRDPLIILYDLYLSNNPLINRLYPELHQYMPLDYRAKYPL